MSISNLYDDKNEIHSFFEKLFVKLELESEGSKAELFASHIETFQLELFPYGFEGKICFRGFDHSEAQKLFESEKRLDVTLIYQTETLYLAKKDPVKIKGIVYKKFSKGIEKKKLEVREYTLFFCDSAKASWSHHFPKAVHIEKTMKDVIDSEKNPLIQIDYDWEALNETSPILAYNLVYSPHQQEDSQVSFYSFLNWYLEEGGGILQYFYKENKYKILAKKSTEGEPTPIAEWWVTSPITTHPSPPRWFNKEVKSFPDHIEEKPEENDKGYEGVRKDWIDKDNTAIFSELQEKKTLSPHTPEKGEATFWIKEIYEDLQFETLFPGKLIQFKGRKKGDDQWSYHPFYKDKVYRFKSLYLKGKKEANSQKVKVAVMPFHCTFKGIAEDKDEPFIMRPSYNPPKYPFFSPGEVFCEVGEEEQTTFNVKKGDKAPFRVYQVKVPLSKEEEKYVICPYSPDTLPGHFYFPLYKKQQVMVSFCFKSATIHRTLDHQPLTELAEDTQACQVVFASKGMNEYLIVKHEYEEGKNSVFTLKQSSSETQIQIVKIQENEIILCAEDKKKRKLTIHIHRDTGLKFEMKDEEGKITHSTQYDSKGITHLSEGDGKKSTVKQTPEIIEMQADTIKIQCKEFFAGAEKVITLKGDGKVVLDAPLTKATQAMTVG